MIILKEHNIRPYEELCRMLETQDKVAYVSATGTGKSYVIGKYIEDHGLIEKTIILVPSVAIKRGWKKLLPQVSVYTYQGITRDNSKVADCKLLVCDEMHHLGAKEWGEACNEIFSVFSGKIIGTTATPVRFLDNQRNITDEIFGGNQVTGMELPEAISQGVLPSFEYITALYDLPKRLKNRRNVTPYTENLYAQLDMMSSQHSFQSILKKHLANEKGIKVAVFVNQISELEGIKSMCETVFPEAGHFIAHSTMKRSDTEAAIRNFESANSMCFLYTVNILNEGVHIDGVDSVIMFRKTESPIIYLQQLGRALSSNNTNKRIKIFDFVANHCNLDSYMKTGSGVIGWISNGISNPDRQIVVSDYVLEELELLEKIRMASLGMWTPDEDQIVRDYYALGKGLSKCKELLPHRSAQAIMFRAGALNVSNKQKKYIYTDEFFKDLVHFYQQENGIESLLKLYPHLSKEIIYSQARRLGMEHPNALRKWTCEEIDILKNNKELSAKQIESLLPGRKAEGIKSMKRKLGLCRKPQNTWTNECDAIILEHPDMSTDELWNSFFKDYKKATVRRHKAELGLSKKRKLDWTDKENELFKILYSTGGVKGVQASPSFCDLRINQIANRARVLNLKYYRVFTSGWDKSEIEMIENYIQTGNNNQNALKDLVKRLPNHEEKLIIAKIARVREFMAYQDVQEKSKGGDAQ